MYNFRCSKKYSIESFDTAYKLEI